MIVSILFIAGGLFIPKVEGQDKKLVGLVLNMPLDYGLESECGRIQSIEVSKIISFHVVLCNSLFHFFVAYLI